MHRNVSVSLLKSVVLLDVVKIVSPYDYRPLHLLTLYNASKDSSTDTNIAGEWTLLINVLSFSGLQYMYNSSN